MLLFWPIMLYFYARNFNLLYYAFVCTHYAFFHNDYAFLQTIILNTADYNAVENLKFELKIMTIDH